MLLRRRVGRSLRQGRRARFVLDRDLEVEGLLGVGGAGVVEAEAVFPRRLRGEDVVALPLRGFGQDRFVVGAADGDVDVECAAGLHLRRLSNVVLVRCRCVGRKRRRGRSIKDLSRILDGGG